MVSDRLTNKNCPFCEGKPEVANYDIKFFIRCTKCSAQGGWGVSEQGAWNWWNMRGFGPLPEKVEGEAIEPAY